MAKILHILKSKPDKIVADLIQASAAEEDIAVVSLYRDEISGSRVDWTRLVKDIFEYDRIICWW